MTSRYFLRYPINVCLIVLHWCYFQKTRIQPRPPQQQRITTKTKQKKNKKTKNKNKTKKKILISKSSVICYEFNDLLTLINNIWWYNWKKIIKKHIIERAMSCLLLKIRPRGGSRTAATSKMERFVIIVNDWKLSTIITKCSILDVAAVLDQPLRPLCF